MAGSDYTFFAA